MDVAEHSPGRAAYDADWRELKLEENGYVIATLPAPHPACRGKERIEALATIKANGERLAALWNAALGVPVVAADNPGLDQGPCTVCGKLWRNHGTYPVYESHNYTPAGGVMAVSQKMSDAGYTRRKSGKTAGGLMREEDDAGVGIPVRPSVQDAVQLAVPSGEWNALAAAAGPDRLLAFCEKFAAALGVSVPAAEPLGSVHVDGRTEP